MMTLLPDIVENEADKLVSPHIQQDIRGIQRKKNGRIEHYDGGHDDSLMAYLIFRYAVFYGTCFRDKFGISPIPTKNNVKTVSSTANITKIASLIESANVADSGVFSNNEMIDYFQDFQRKNGGGNQSHVSSMFSAICNLNHD
jgi:hypothetical protein